MCKLKVGWDDKIPQHFAVVRLAVKLTSSVKTEGESMYQSDFGQLKHAQLHHFSDASEFGYGTESFLR